MGLQCRIPTRYPQPHRGLKLNGPVELVAADIFDQDQLEKLFADCDAVINLVGILNEGGNNRSFRHIHIELPDMVIKACKNTRVNRLLHMSALKASETKDVSSYLHTKGEAQNRVLTHSIGRRRVHVTTFGPSVIFGHDDSFFNRFATLLNLAPGPFPLACPDARFAPVYVGDVAQAFANALDNNKTWKRHYDLCGPRVFTLRELVTYTARQMGVRKSIIRLSDSISRLQSHVLGLLPGKPFSYDNYLSLQTDNVCERNGLLELGVTPTDVDAVVPYYLGQRSAKGRYCELRRQA